MTEEILGRYKVQTNGDGDGGIRVWVNHEDGYCVARYAQTPAGSLAEFYACPSALPLLSDEAIERETPAYTGKQHTWSVASQLVSAAGGDGKKLTRLVNYLLREIEKREGVSGSEIGWSFSEFAAEVDARFGIKISGVESPIVSTTARERSGEWL